MNSRILLLLLAVLSLLPAGIKGAEPLRVFIRAGIKTHGPGQHDHPRFLGEWSKLLDDRGARASGAMNFPTAEQLEATDVLVMFAAEAGTISADERVILEKFLDRGGGMVVLHDAVCGTDPEWFKTIIGGAWEHRRSKWLEGEVGMYFLDTEHPITRGVSNFDLKDEIYYDLHMMPEARVLASSFHTPFVVAPQMWVYEKEDYRAFVCLLGHEYSTFDLPHVRALLLRGIAWAGKRSNVNELCKPEELASLKYPEGGPTAPEKADEKFIVHPDFTLNLVASEPLIEKAISLDWDHRGRLWVAETPEYPGGRTVNPNDNPVATWRDREPERFKAAKEDRPARDRISFLEDRNGDGVMDRKKVFHEGLELVTSLVFYKDGVIVTQAPDILWIRDTDRDGESDKVEKLYTGLGTMDTHAVASNLRWGMDGWVYSAVGYSGGNLVSPDGSRRFGRLTAGIFRFKPDGSAVEQVASGSCNTWGMDFTWDNEIIYTTATCGEPICHVVLPEPVLARGSIPGTRSTASIAERNIVFPAITQRRIPYVQIDWVGQFTAATGSCVYDGGAWPERFNNSHFVSEATVNLVHHELLLPDGVTFAGKKEEARRDAEFLNSTDHWFRPVHQRFGPDGALYVLDFYNQAAVHNDTRGPKHGAHNAAVRPDRDHHFARIWRLQHKQARKLPMVQFDRDQPTQLVKTLEHPNGWARMTAHRLLLEKGGDGSVGDLEAVIRDSRKPAARLHALHLLAGLGQLKPASFKAALADADPAVRKNALQLVGAAGATAGPEATDDVLQRLKDADARTRLFALVAAGSFEVSEDIALAVIETYPSLKDRWSQSAALGAAASDPVLYARVLLAASKNQGLMDLAGHVGRLAGGKQDAEIAARLVVVVAAAAAGTETFQQVLIENLTAALKPEITPSWSPDLEGALRALVSSRSGGITGAVLPLIVRWDKNQALTAAIKPRIADLTAQLTDAGLPDDRRAQVAINLLGVRSLDSSIVPAVARVLASGSSSALQRRVVEALGNTAEPEAGAALVAALPRLPSELVEPAFAQIVRRADWSMALLESVRNNRAPLSLLGPASIHRLRTHSDKAVSDRAIAVVEEIRGPEVKEKDALIARFSSAVERPGDLENGKKLFAANCASCHKFKGEGRDLAPDLTGMGAHGAHDLLVHILDPNRVVEPNFVAVSIETKDDQSMDGVVMRENASTITLRNATTDLEIPVSNVKSRRSTGLSLMPNGYEALEADGLRDLIGYLCADENRFRVLDMTPAFTANSTRGIYASQESANESLRFVKFGLTKVDGVPFEVIHPTRSQTGNNVVVLKGGSGFSRTLPSKVEFKAGVAASALHFLGGVGGWAFPCCGENKNEGMPVAKVTLHFAGGGTEEMILKNGVEFADYNGRAEVPGSKEVPGLVRYGQVRWFSKPVAKQEVIERITLEGYDNAVAPTFVAITAELAGQNAASAAPQASTSSGGIRALIVGGGSSHDFQRWFNLADAKTLEASGAKVSYTEKMDSVLPALPNIDVLYLSNNQPMPDPALRKGIFEFAEAGRGLLLIHPALWYNWRDWPEYNRVLVGGGSRSHDKYGEFEVTVTEPNHPIMAGVPGRFKITDELYRVELDPAGTPIQVLATGYEVGTQKTYPILWVVKHPKARIVCNTLGHDGLAHDHPAYKQILQNSLKWAAGGAR